MVCVCRTCDQPPAADDTLCEFCLVHCPREMPSRFEESLAGILCWRTHLVRDALLEDGLDPMVWWPLVLAHGTLAKAEQWWRERRALRAEFNRLCRRDDNA